MRAVIATKKSDDGISTIIIKNNEPIPQLHKSDYVVVRTHYAAINPFDWQLVQCLMGKSAPVIPPFICGRDFCGKIISIGNKVTNCKIGDFVCGQSYTYYGSMADYLRISSSRIRKFNPQKISLPQAAAIPCIGQTAWQALIAHAKLTCNHKLLILGGTTQCGIVGIQIARNIVKVKNITVTSSKPEYCYNTLGVDKVINYRNNEIWWDILKNHKFNVIFDCIGGDESWINATKYNVLDDNCGIFVTIVGDDNSGGSWTNWLRSSYQYVDMKGKENLDDVLHFVGNGRINPLIDDKNGIFKFDKVVELFKYAKSRKGFGKCLLTVFDEKSNKFEQAENEVKGADYDDMKSEHKEQLDVGLKFDAVNHGKNVDFKDEFGTVKGRYGWNICIGNVIISNKVCDEYEWEIKCNDIGSGKYCMGFIDGSNGGDYEFVIDDWHNWLGKYKKRVQYSVYVNSGNNYFVLDGGYSGLTDVKCEVNGASNFKSGNVFRFKISFKKGIVELFYNDKSMGIIFDNIPDDIVPAVALYKKCELSISNVNSI